MNLVARQQARDLALDAWSATPAGSAHAGVVREVADLSRQRALHQPRAFLLSSIARGPSLLALAIDLVRRAHESSKPDLDREPSYMDRNRDKLWKLQQRRLLNFDADVEAHLVASLIDRADVLVHRIAALDAIASRAAEAGQSTLDHVRALVAASTLSDAAVTKQSFDAASISAIAADPLITLASELLPIIEAVDGERDALDGADLRVGPRWFALLASHHKGPLYPDANGTLRFSYATVKGYAPRDGLWAVPQTSLRGALAKHSGDDPFDLAAKVRDAAPDAANSYWFDPKLNDLPICFLGNGDTTGGNSGSPVVNGKGQLVGLNFDRVWENIAGDFGYDVGMSRNVMVELRYLWWMLDRVDDAGALLAELGLSRYRTAAPRSRWIGAPRPPARNAVGCHMAPHAPVRMNRGALGWPWLCAAFMLLWRRRGGAVVPGAGDR
jgi:hypothetical protein